MERVLLLQESETNRRLLRALLPDMIEVRGDDDGQLIGEPFDLCIVDEHLLHRHHLALVARKEHEHPTFLPILLITPHGRVSMIESGLWQAVDDVVQFPVEPRELEARAALMVRCRRLSQEPHTAERSPSPIPEDRLREVVKLVADYAYTARVDADGRLVLEWVTGSLIGVGGADLTDIGAPEAWTRLVHSDDALTVGRRCEALLAGRPHDCEFRVVSPAGNVRWLRDTARPQVDPGSGRVVRIIGSTRDITNSKRLEDELRHSHKIEAMGRLASGVTHDFNNLLQALLSTVELYQFQAGDHQSARVLEELEVHLKRGASLTRQLLLFARREAIKHERLELNHLLHDMTRLLRRLARENINFVVEPCATHLPVDGDRGQLEQVLTNLVVNATDAMPEGGTLWVRTGDHDDGHVWFEVEDTGNGIPQPARRRIFEPFFTTKDGEEGTGIGLSVVQEVVAGHGGWIEVDTRENRGTCFRVTLPRGAIRSLAAAADDDRRTAVLGQGQRLLLVEDDPGIRHALARFLSVLGYQVVDAATAEEAQALPADQPFDLLIADLILPGLPGHLLARQLMSRWPTLRAILMSGYSDIDITGDGSQAHGLHFLAKPFDMATLSHKVQEVLGEVSGAA